MICAGVPVGISCGLILFASSPITLAFPSDTVYPSTINEREISASVVRIIHIEDAAIRRVVKGMLCLSMLI
jgi:hypothetical protein